MRTTEKLTVTVAKPVAGAARAEAERSGETLSALTNAALREYLIRRAVADEPETDREWLEAAARTIVEDEAAR
ncbi:hypothetical protein [Nocardia huaxiensis]|uniref:Uncharacterized protein n=1 Tax=Nocardia huaxiensis TaxID=2755382 RepID=A0A7D6V9R0_9NOCA|nr:hypothetical protein [Nocardia huaxiensis]QLY31192.1 hypothetical protein H0264_02040 [Nocardia huaxiensis]UFS94721.1 hypothetical protein LPY97_28875 [Nocardia huaxiensis]